MAKASSFIVNFLRLNPRTVPNPNTQIRNLTIESKETSFIVKEIVKNQKPCEEQLNDSVRQSNLDIVKQVCKITRTVPRWEETLVSHFPSFNFSEPWFFRELLRQQDNVFFSLRFFHWLRSEYEFSPDFDSCNMLFDKLVEAKASKAARNFLQQTGFEPKPGSLERYLRCLCENESVEEAVDVFSTLSEIGHCPSIETWNLALSACLKVGRNDLMWKLYQDMVESGIGVNIDVGTLGCLVQAFCIDGKASKGYKILQQNLADGLVPDTVAFHKLIAAFCKMKDYGRVSQLLHTMIATDRAPNIYTYQEVINGLCKNRKWLEGFRIFNDLKDRGHSPDRVMYTTIIHGLCKIGELREARKLWFEMINKGMVPNEYTYNALLNGLYRAHNLKEAERLYKEMLEKGYGEMTVSYNTMITGLCSHGKTDEAYCLFEEMPRKGVVRDLITFNNLIRGFCVEGKVVESLNLLHELLAQGLQPSASSYTPIIKCLCQAGHIEEAESLLNDMHSQGLEPKDCTRNHLIFGLCKQGHVAEGMERFKEMLENQLKPQKKTLEKLIQSLSESDSFPTVSFYRSHFPGKHTTEREKMFAYDRVSHSSANKADEIDLESGETLYPGLSYGENQLRWGFIRKVYGILAAQLVLTTVVSAFVVLSAPVNELLRGNSGLLLFLCLIPFVLLWPLHVYHQKHPVNLVILGLFTVSLSLTVGVSCANTDGRIVLEALILTAAVVASLTGYTFWASKKGKDFSYLGPILFTGLIILILTGLIQMFFPLGPTSTAVYGGISALIFCGYIVYDTDNLIKRFTYDDYILASATLYLDILNLFISILRVLRSGDN